jgi:osmoprotectant transport system substrate-binding protein
MQGSGRRRVLGAVCGTLATAGCTTSGSETAAPPERVAVGSKRFTTNRLLGWLTFETLLASDVVQPVDHLGTGGTTRTWRALVDGDGERDVDCYWEYTGTVWRTVLGRERRFDDRDALYDAVVDALAARDVTVATRGRYDNSYVLYARGEWVRATDVRTLSEFVAWVESGKDDVSVAITDGFDDRPDGWDALLDFYGVDGDARERLAAATDVVEPLVTYDLLADGTYDVGVGYSTNPNVDAVDVVPLADDRRFFPAYEPVLLVDATAAGAAAVVDATDPIGGTLSSASVVRALTARVVFDDESPRAVARAHLEEAGVL